VTVVSALRFVECDAVLFGRQVTTLPDFFYLQVILNMDSVGWPRYVGTCLPNFTVSHPRTSSRSGMGRCGLD